MSTMMKNGFTMNCKEATSNLFKVVGILVGSSKANAKPNNYLEAYSSISQHPIIETYSTTVIPPSHPSSFFTEVY